MIKAVQGHDIYAYFCSSLMFLRPLAPQAPLHFQRLAMVLQGVSRSSTFIHDVESILCDYVESILSNDIPSTLHVWFESLLVSINPFIIEIVYRISVSKSSKFSVNHRRGSRLLCIT